jgi:hypothetical protein
MIITINYSTQTSTDYLSEYSVDLSSVLKLHADCTRLQAIEHRLVALSCADRELRKLELGHLQVL